MNKTQKTPLTWLEHYKGDDRIPLERTEYAYSINSLSGSIEPDFQAAFKHPRIVYSVKDIQKFFEYQEIRSVRDLIKRVETEQPQLKEDYRFRMLLKPKIVVKKRKGIQIPFLNSLDMNKLQPKERLEYVLQQSGESTKRGRYYTLSFIAALTTVSSMPRVQAMGLNIQVTLRGIAQSFMLHSDTRLITKSHCKEKNACFEPLIKHLPKGPAQAAQYAKVGGLHYYALFGHQKSTLDKMYKVFKENTFKEYFDQNWLDLWDYLDKYIIYYMSKVKGDYVPPEEERIPILNAILGDLKKKLRIKAVEEIAIRGMDVNDILIEKKLVSCV